MTTTSKMKITIEDEENKIRMKTISIIKMTKNENDIKHKDDLHIAGVYMALDVFSFALYL